MCEGVRPGVLGDVSQAGTRKVWTWRVPRAVAVCTRVICPTSLVVVCTVVRNADHANTVRGAVGRCEGEVTVVAGAGELRPVDLARAVGVSAQTVRDCEASGVLPPARRTGSGQRRFTRIHLAALVAYRALAPGMGVAAAGEVLRTLHGQGVDAALESVEAAFARAHREREAVREAARALAAVASAPGPVEREEPAVLAGVRARREEGPLRIGAAARLVGVRASALRVWERAGLVRPVRDPRTGYRVYGPGQVREVRVVSELRRGGYGLEQIASVMEELRSSGGGGALEGALRRRERDLAARTRALAVGVARLQDYLDLLEAAHP